MAKSKNGMITRAITQPATDPLQVIVTECSFSLLPLARCPLWLTTVNRYHPRDSNGNVSVVRYEASLVIFLLIRWIQRIQWKSFRENSNTLKIRPALSCFRWQGRNWACCFSVLIPTFLFWRSVKCFHGDSFDVFGLVRRGCVSHLSRTGHLYQDMKHFHRI